MCVGVCVRDNSLNELTNTFALFSTTNYDLCMPVCQCVCVCVLTTCDNNNQKKNKKKPEKKLVAYSYSYSKYNNLNKQPPGESTTQF